MIHPEDPFATPEDQRSPVRRLRGRLPAPVTLFTAALGTARAGLTVSSVLVVDGEPGRVLAVVDEESEFWETAAPAGRFALTQLGVADRQLADRFAGMLPAPGGLFATGEWTATDFGPVPARLGRGAPPTWIGCRIDDSRPVGWGRLVEATIEAITFASGAGSVLVHVRGRYRELPLA
jgi:3-hydroxy-9,10-secoandrosta-1,3,5(10)-triene-9,17-dione monooxygenase reductase component